MRVARRSILAVAAAFCLARLARAEPSVPPGLQGQLVAKVAAFDRNLAARAGGRVLALVVRLATDAESSRVAAALARALDDLPDIGGIPKSTEIVDYVDPGEIAAAVRAKGPSLVYFASGLELRMAAIAAALEGCNVLTFGATGAFAEAGANVGFDLEGSRPKIVVNLATCRAQGVSLKAELLKLARVVGG